MSSEGDIFKILKPYLDAEDARRRSYVQSLYCRQHCKTMCQNAVHGVCDGEPLADSTANKP